VVDGVNSLNLHLEAFLTEDAGGDPANALRAVFVNVGVTAFGTSGKVAAPLAKMTHLETLEALGRTRLEFGGLVVAVVEEDSRLFAAGGCVFVDEREHN
jgi:hypothetical protein